MLHCSKGRCFGRHSAEHRFGHLGGAVCLPTAAAAVGLRGVDGITQHPAARSQRAANCELVRAAAGCVELRPVVLRCIGGCRAQTTGGEQTY